MKLDATRLRDLVSDSVASEELEAIFQETQATLLLGELSNFARRQAEAGRPEIAAGIGAWISQLPPETGANDEAFAAFAGEACADLEALTGRGSFGRRAEFLTRRFFRESTDYRAILPMMLGGIVGNYAGTLVLGRFSSGVELGLGGSLRARAWAGAAALAAEVPTYALSNRALLGWSGNSQDWDPSSLASDFVSCLFSFGAMKLGGAFGEEGRALLPDFKGVGALLPMVMQFPSLLAAQRLESALGLRPKIDLASELTDGLATLLSLEAGARVGRQILGPEFRALQARLQFRNTLYRQWLVSRPEVRRREVLSPSFFEMTIGRGRDSEMELDPNRIGSNYFSHMRGKEFLIRSQDGFWEIVNGSGYSERKIPILWKNGKRIWKSASVTEGDRIQVGELEFEFRLPDWTDEIWRSPPSKGEALGWRLLSSPPFQAQLSRVLGRGDATRWSEAELEVAWGRLVGEDLRRLTQPLLEGDRENIELLRGQVAEAGRQWKAQLLDDWMRVAGKVLEASLPNGPNFLDAVLKRSFQLADPKFDSEGGSLVRLSRFSVAQGLFGDLVQQIFPSDLRFFWIPAKDPFAREVPSEKSLWQLMAARPEAKNFWIETSLGDLRRSGVVKTESTSHSTVEFHPGPAGASPALSYRAMARIGDQSYEWSGTEVSSQDTARSRYDFRLSMPAGDSAPAGVSLSLVAEAPTGTEVPFVIEVLDRMGYHRADSHPFPIALEAQIPLLALEQPEWFQKYRQAIRKTDLLRFLSEEKSLRDLAFEYPEASWPPGKNLAVQASADLETSRRLLSYPSGTLQRWLAEQGYIRTAEGAYEENENRVEYWKGIDPLANEILVKMNVPAVSAKGDPVLALALPLLGMMGVSWQEPRALLAMGVACMGMSLWDRVLRPKDGDGRVDDPIQLGPERSRGMFRGRREPMSPLRVDESDLRLGKDLPFIKKTVLEDYCLLGNCTVGKVGGSWWIFREFESPFFGNLTFSDGSRPEGKAKVGHLYPLDPQDRFLMDAMSYVWDRDGVADLESRQNLDVRNLNRHILLGDLRGIRQAGVYYRDDFARNLSIHYQSIQVNPYPVHPTWNALIDPRNGLIAALGSGAPSEMVGMVRVKMHFDRLVAEPTYQPRIRRLEFCDGWQPEEPLRGQLEGLIGLEVRPLLLHPMIVLDARRNGLPEIPLPAQAPMR